MEVISTDTLRSAIEILGGANIENDEIDSRISALVNNSTTLRRLADWPPEAFGYVLISHGWNVILPTTFSAQNKQGKWLEFNFECEPIFAASLVRATHMYHNSPRDIFKNVSLRSSMINAVNNALNSGATIDGATLSGPALIGIPAEIYQKPQKPFWQRLIS